MNSDMLSTDVMQRSHDRLYFVLMLLTLLAVLLLAASALAQTPRTISYQGSIANNSVALSGNHRLHIALYDSLIATASIYEEDQQVTVRNGIFDLQIGSVVPFPPAMRFDRVYYLGISIDGSAELQPRTQLSSVPYALNAAVAQSAESLTSDAHGVVTSINELDGALRIVGDSTTTITQSGNEITIHARSIGASGIQSITSPDKTLTITNASGPQAGVDVADNAITTAKLANGAVTPLKIAQAGATKGQVLKWNGSAWNVSNDSLNTYSAGPGISIVGNTISNTGQLPTGTTPSSTIRWNGSAWVENTQMTSDASGNTKINGSTILGSGTGATGITMKPGTGNVQVTGWDSGFVSSNSAGVLSTVKLSAGPGIQFSKISDTLRISNTGSAGWLLQGNSGTIAGTNFIGTTDNEPFEIHVNDSSTIGFGNKRVMRFEPNAISANIIAGSQNNSVSGYGGTISGGGRGPQANHVTGDFGTIAGGWDNQAADESTVSGGNGNNASGGAATISGGDGNRAIGLESTVSGGRNNTAFGMQATVSGGQGNIATAGGSTVAGGDANAATGGLSTVGGGNVDSANGGFSTVSGGLLNTANGVASAIPGGDSLRIGISSFGMNVPGVSPLASILDLTGFSNLAYFGNMDLWLGNTDNRARALRFYTPSVSTSYGTRAYSSFSAGLQSSTINYTLPIAQPSPNQLLAATAVSGTGPYNVTMAWSDASAFAWGLTGNNGTNAGSNYLGTQDNQPFEIHIYNSDGGYRGSKRVLRFEPENASPNIIAGFQYNSVSSGVNGATISGGGSSGDENQIAGDYGTVAGGRDNRINSGIYSTISGGGFNMINSNSDYAFIGGGNSNILGSAKYATIGGGIANSIYGMYSVIPGGDSLRLGSQSFGINMSSAASAQAITDLSSFSNLAYLGNIDLWLGNTDNSARAVRFYAPSTSAVYSTRPYSAFRAGAQLSTINYTLPTSTPSANQVLAATNVTGSGPYDVQLGWANASGATAWALTGNSGTTIGTNFLGTTDNVDLQFRANNVQSGLINVTGASGNTGGNTGFGYGVLTNNSTGFYNAAFGYQALQSNTTGFRNTANGYLSLNANTTGSDNTAIGTWTLWRNTTGVGNIAVGTYSLFTNTTGSNNTATGIQTLQANTTGYSNTAIGLSALATNTSGYQNTSIGINSLYYNSTGYNNTASGNSSLTTNRTGNSNTGLGCYSDVASTSLSNATAIGANAQVAASNALVLGSINNVNGATADVYVGIGTVIPLQKLDVENGNILLSRSGSNAVDTLQFQGTSTGKSTFAAGAQGTTTINYTLPVSQPSTNQVLAATAVSGSGPYNVTLGWASANGNGWGLTGNSSTTAGTNFLGTTDNQPFEIHVYDNDAPSKGSKRVLRFEPNATSANVTMGYNGNTISSAVTTSAILGGGEPNWVNTINASRGVIAGGVDNTITSTGTGGTIVGGIHDTVSGNYSVAIGGDLNIASGGGATAIGGAYNVASAGYAFVTGVNNTAAGNWSTIPGGGALSISNSSFGYNNPNGNLLTYAANLLSGAGPYNAVAYFGNVDIWLGNTGGYGPGQLRFYQTNSGTTYTTSTYYSAFKAPSSYTSGSILYTLPSSQPSANQVLTATNVSGSGPYNVTLGWANNSGNTAWNLTGNSGTTAGTNFLGTTDNQAFEIHVYDNDGNASHGDRRVMRYEYGLNCQTITGGYHDNTNSGDGAVIAGGGASSGANSISSTGSLAAIGGGRGNSISGQYSAIAGGDHNSISGDDGFVGAGYHNWIDYENLALTSIIQDAVISGGEVNEIKGTFSAIAGGYGLTLSDNSFGYNASKDVLGSGTADLTGGGGPYNNVAYFGNVDLWLGNTGGFGPRQLRFYQTNSGTTYSSSTYYSAFKAPTNYTGGSITYTLPSSAPSANGALLLASSGSSSTMAWSSGLVWDNTNARLGINIATPVHVLHSVNSATTDELAAIFGNATGSTTSQSIGLWGSASNTTSTNTGTIAVLATGNGNTSAGNTNVALQVNDGEFTMGRTTEAPGAGSTVESASGGTAYSAQGPSGMIELTLGASGNLATSAPTANAMQNLGSITINNRYCQSGSIVLVNVAGMIDDGSAPDPRDAGFIVNTESTASGSFVLRIKMIPSVTNSSNYSTSDKIRIGYMIVNKSK